MSLKSLFSHCSAAGTMPLPAPWNNARNRRCRTVAVDHVVNACWSTRSGVPIIRESHSCPPNAGWAREPHHLCANSKSSLRALDASVSTKTSDTGVVDGNPSAFARSAANSVSVRSPFSCNALSSCSSAVREGVTATAGGAVARTERARADASFSAAHCVLCASKAAARTYSLPHAQSICAELSGSCQTAKGKIKNQNWCCSLLTTHNQQD
ncbi:Hypothetical protein, putative, partial [Bodo saltans]